MYLEKVASPDELKKLTVAELRQYADEVRRFIVDSVKKNGGHLASNLGAAELSIALHYAFNSPRDKIIWDVGHQAYTHKLITGRREGFENLRTNEGISGFPSINESPHDFFTSGHSSNSLSLALGLARARDLNGDDFSIIPVIGDGAFTGGMVYEALNDIGASQARIIIILNDNKMSISKNVGAMSKYFARLRLSLKYNKLKQNIKKGLSSLPFTDGEFKMLDKIKVRFKSFVMADRLFENFGIMYYGPFDGHNIAEMLEVLKKASLKNKPVIVHLITQKGKGYDDAEIYPEKFHGLTPVNENGQAFSKVLGETLIEMAANNGKIAAITAAMSSGTGLEAFEKRFPERYFDVSIAEQHAVTMCAGLAAGGMKPFFAVYSTFLQRGFDQIMHDVCLNRLPVTFAIDRAGAIGADGVTHQGLFDISYLNLIPNLTIMTPKDVDEFKQMLYFAQYFNGPLAIRYPKSCPRAYGVCAPIKYGKWETLITAENVIPENVTAANIAVENLRVGLRIYILAAGCRMVDLAYQVKDFKADKAINIVNARFIKPLDGGFLDSINEKGNFIITLEDNVRQGGFGEAVLSYYGNNLKAAVRILAHPDCFSDNRNIDSCLAEAGLSVTNILAIIEDFKKGFEKLS